MIKILEFSNTQIQQA